MVVAIPSFGLKLCAAGRVFRGHFFMPQLKIPLRPEEIAQGNASLWLAQDVAIDVRRLANYAFAMRRRTL
jgi:hypothetical protein